MGKPGRLLGRAGTQVACARVWNRGEALDGDSATAAAAGGAACARLAAGRSPPVSLRVLRHSSRHEWLVAGCLLVLLALVASAIAGGMPGAEQIPVQLRATLEQQGPVSSISPHGQGPPGDRKRVVQGTRR